MDQITGKQAIAVIIDELNKHAYTKASSIGIAYAISKLTEIVEKEEVGGKQQDDAINHPGD